MIRSVARLTTLCLLAACATPAERCVIDATKELRRVEALIAETEGNLARGYAIDRTAERRPRLTFCTGTYRSQVGVSFCTEEDIVYRERPVAIDPQAERRKLSILADRRIALRRTSEQQIAACRSQ